MIKHNGERNMEKLIAFRDWLGSQIKANGGAVIGSGAFLTEPIADLSIEMDGEVYAVIIRHTGDASPSLPADYGDALRKQQEAFLDGRVTPLLTPFNSNPSR